MIIAMNRFRTMRYLIRLSVLCAGIGVGASVQAADMAGAADHPKIPRVAGSVIIGYEQTPYDLAPFVSGVDGRNLQITEAEGRRTRILYLAKDGDSPLMVQRNYETALSDLGSVEQIYTCRDDCQNQLSTHLWGMDVQIPTAGLEQSRFLIAYAHNYRNPDYRYARVTTSDGRLHVGVFAATIRDNNPNVSARNRTVVLLEVLEEEEFEATLEFVDADTMRGEIGNQGFVNLYGIYFDTDQATLRAESDATLTEIAKALEAEPSLSVYVVGHTDGVGALDYNQKLSLQRARAVVAAIVQRGVAESRLTAVGVGPAAPVASNASEDGRALNRRVVLVERL